MAVMADKDYVEMAQIIAPIADVVYTVTVDSGRALQAKNLADSLVDNDIKAISCDSFEAALDQSLSSGMKTIAFGSLYFVGEVLEKFDS